MCKIIGVTNRHLCSDDFIKHIKKVAASGVDAVILREKDMCEDDYTKLAKQVMGICNENNILCVLHSFTKTARILKCEAIHLPMHILRSLDESERKVYKVLGGSCHSVSEAVEAERLGCTYITAGHVFVTDCKKGLEPRGTAFLKSVCEAVNIPVYAIGGIDATNVASVMECGVSGVCIMSGLMKCVNPMDYTDDLKKGMKI